MTDASAGSGTDPRTDPEVTHREGDEDHELADSERAATHQSSEDVAPGVIKDGHGEIQPDPYPDRPEHAEDGPDRTVIEQHRADAHDLEHHRTGAVNPTLGTVAEAEAIAPDPARTDP